jgi:TatD DNase family protein
MPVAMRLVDSHAHLQADRIAGETDAIVEAARAAGVERMLVPGWNRRSSDAAVELVERFDWLDAGAGIHPHDAADATAADWARVEELASHPRVLAIGETGLDYDRRFSPIEAQLENLRRHLALALDTGKPAILHCRSRAGERDAQDALHAELLAAGYGTARAAAFAGRPGAVIHSFSGPVDYAVAMLDLGLAVSFSGLVFRRGEETSAEAVRRVPPDRLLLETDSPFLPPPGAPRRNTPEWVRITGAWVAEQRDESPDVVGAAVVASYDATFTRPGGR